MLNERVISNWIINHKFYFFPKFSFSPSASTQVAKLTFSPQINPTLPHRIWCYSTLITIGLLQNKFTCLPLNLSPFIMFFEGPLVIITSFPSILHTGPEEVLINSHFYAITQNTCITCNQQFPTTKQTQRLYIPTQCHMSCTIKASV